MKKNTVFALIITIALLASNLSMVFADDGSIPEPAEATDAATEDTSTKTEEIFQENENTETVNFTTSKLPENWETGGTTVLTGDDQIDPEGDGWLRLTGKTGYELGYAVYDEALSTENGLAFQFDYTSWGGSGADGISFFLFDGETSMEEFNIGGTGGSLGYAPRHKVSEGLSNAVVGIALDEMGNYSAEGEGRVGGQGRTPDSVSIRGEGDGFKGYEFVDGTEKLVEGIDIRNTSSRPDQTGKDYRNVSVVFTPIEKQFSLTLNIQFGAEKESKTLFSNLVLPGSVPATVKFGFVATSGSATNFHEIRNLIIDKAVLNDMKEEIEEEQEEDEQEEEEQEEEEQEEEEQEEEEQEQEETPVKDKSKKTVSIPVTAIQNGDTLTIIPVTSATMYPLSCTGATKLEIQDRAYAILPALCDQKASLEMEEPENNFFNLSEQFEIINAASLVLENGIRIDATSANGQQIELGFYIEDGLDPQSLGIFKWESGQLIEMKVKIGDGVISTETTEGGLFILIEK